MEKDHTWVTWEATLLHLDMFPQLQNEEHELNNLQACQVGVLVNHLNIYIYIYIYIYTCKKSA